LDDPRFGADPLGAVASPGRLPQGDPLGVVPGVVEVFGFTVEGCVLFPDDGGLVEFAPGTFDGGTDPVGGGVLELVGGGVVELVGGALGEDVAAPV
jgi:hypothetical protein